MTPSAGALELARRLAALPEPAMREHVLATHLATCDPDDAIRVLADVHTFGRRAGPPFNIALLTLVGVLSGELLDYELRARLYSAAKEAALEDLQALFLSSRPEELAAGRDEQTRELTLGHRKTMARSTRRETLDRLLRDPEPEVVPILLRNPRLTERDVVLLAARRPALAEVQREIFGTPRWIARYAVKRGLVLNPYTPTEISLRLLGFLSGPDLMLVCSSPTLPEPVRAAAGRLAARAAPKE